MIGKKLTCLICLSIAGFAIFFLSMAFWLRAHRTSLQDVKIGLPAWRVKFAKAFNYDKNGHFGARTQYLSNQADADKGYYCLQCQRGKVSAVFVKYDEPIKREQSLRTLKRLLGDGKVCERDSSELTLAGSLANSATGRKAIQYFASPSEYIYFDNGKAAELQYVGPNDQRVTDIKVWGRGTEIKVWG